MDGLEKDIKEMIESLYNCYYNKGLKVQKIDSLYKLTLELWDPNFGGLVIAKECNSDKEFLDYIYKELRTRRLDRSQYAQLRIYGNIETTEGF